MEVDIHYYRDNIVVHYNFSEAMEREDKRFQLHISRERTYLYWDNNSPLYNEWV